jgi:hypothetical protein
MVGRESVDVVALLYTPGGFGKNRGTECLTPSLKLVTK